MYTALYIKFFMEILKCAPVPNAELYTSARNKKAGTFKGIVSRD
jgi:hypothetical protein